MTRSGRWTLFGCAALGVIALSTGSSLFLYAAVLLALLLLLGGIAVGWASRTLRLETSLRPAQVRRGEEAVLRVEVRHRGLLPVAPLRLCLETGDRLREEELRPRGETLEVPFTPRHVGRTRPGIRYVEAEDLFGLWRKRLAPAGMPDSLLTLPLLFETDPLIFAPGDPGAETMARAGEDLSSPSDVRAYQTGDSMKKIHWKLSARKGDLLVRRYDEQVLQDALVLMDCSAPPAWGHPEAAADVRDTLLETAASVMASVMGTEHGISLPLQGEGNAVELGRGMGLDAVCERLAEMEFTATEPFEQVLLLESRRLRSVGSLVIITARLNGAMVDLMTRMRRMGPTLRLYLVTFTPDDPRLASMITRLQQAEAEVCYVRPGVVSDRGAAQ